MSAKRHIIPAILLTAAVSAAGCGSSSPAAPPATSPSHTSSAAASHAAPGSGLVLAGVVECLRNKGVPLSPGAKIAQIKDTFLAMPKARRRQAYNACAYLLPPAIREEIQQRISQATASPTASP